MRKIVIALVVLSLLLASCAGSPSPIPTVPEALTPMPEESFPVPKTNGTPSPIVLPKEPPEHMTWISPGKVIIGNFYPGARAEYELSVHNGKDKIARFEVKYRTPDHVGADYVKAPMEAQDWVIIADATPVIMPKDTKEILVVLDMPLEVSAPPKWEFWISVKDTTQTGMVQTELCSRWLINMRE